MLVNNGTPPEIIHSPKDTYKNITITDIIKLDGIDINAIVPNVLDTIGRVTIVQLMLILMTPQINLSIIVNGS